MASLARAPAGPSTHVPCLTSAPRVTFPAPFTPSGGVPQRAPGCNFPRPYQDMALFLFAEQKENNIKWRRRRKKIGVRCKNLASYTTESLNEPFLRSKKGKMTPPGFFLGGAGGDAVPPQILGGNASPPGGGRILTWEKKDMGGGWGSPAHTPIWDTTYVTRTRKKRGGRESSAREARLIPFLASL